MKTCLLCSSIVPAESVTCPNCGEGSFDGSSAMSLPVGEQEPTENASAASDSTPEEAPSPEADAAPEKASAKPRGGRRNS